MKNKEERPNRKPTRLKGFDYGKPYVYFLTICTQNRKHILSTIVGEGSPLPKLSHYGEITEKWIQKIPEKYPNILAKKYVIMPNHIHLLLSITKTDGRGAPSPTVSSVIGWLKYQITKEINQSICTVGTKIFQRSFFDHIIRTDDDYCEIFQYIQHNPQNWYYDQLYAEE